MERCQLRLKLPALDAPLPDPFHFAGDAGVALVDVYEAPVLDRLMDLSTLSWARKPPFRAHVGTFAGTPAREVTLPEFPCKWGEVRTFKMSCAPQNPECVVDVWSSQNTTWGERARHVSAAVCSLTPARNHHVPAPDCMSSRIVAKVKVVHLVPVKETDFCE